MTCHHVKSATGYSLIELVIFIMVMAILGTALFAGFNVALNATASSDVNAHRIAQERMELILAQKRVLGFSGFTAATFDPCTSTPVSTQAVCSAIPAGYIVSATLAPNWNGNVNYKVITLTVTGKSQASLVALVADY